MGFQGTVAHFTCVFPAVGGTWPEPLASSSDGSSSWRNKQPWQPEATVSCRPVLFFSLAKSLLPVLCLELDTHLSLNNMESSFPLPLLQKLQYLTTS